MTIKAAADELAASNWVLIDFDAERAWLCFIAEDAFSSPLIYVSAMNKIRTCRSWMLRDAAWKEIQRLGLPTSEADRTQRSLKKALDALRAKMYTNPEGLRSKDFRDSIERVSETVSIGTGVGVEAGTGEAAEACEQTKLLCATKGCNGEAGPDGVCAECVKAQPW